MAVSRFILPVCFKNCTIRFSPSTKLVLTENCRGLQCLRVAPISRRDKRFKRHMLVCNNILPDGTPIPSGSSGSWKGWIVGLLVTLIFPMWRNKLGPLGLLKNKLDTVVQTVEDIVDVVEEVADQVDKLAEEVSEHLPEGGKLRHAVEVMEDLAEETAKQAHLLGEVIDKVQEVEDKLEEVMDHPVMALAAEVHMDKAMTTVAATDTSPEKAAELDEKFSNDTGNESLSSGQQ